VDIVEWLTLADVEHAARDAVDPATWTYIAGGAGSSRTVDANAAAFDDLWFVPRLPAEPLQHPDTSVSLATSTLPMPVLLAPTSPQRLLHVDAELATARAAHGAGIVSIVSSDSHYAFPEIAEAGSGHCWFQLYPYRSREDMAAAIELAECAGAKALVVTVDASYPARRLAAKRAGFCTPAYVDFGTLRRLGILTGDVPPDARLERLALTWSDLEWIRRRTRLPLYVKGVLHPDDSRRCVEAGATGVIVSNHGGRQLDGSIPALCALEAIVDSVGERCEVLLDGGVRSGLDVVKAVALGADAVCLGRPYLWGLCADGERGIRAVLRLVRQEIADTLRQLGVARLSTLDPTVLARSDDHRIRLISRAPHAASLIAAQTDWKSR
jgi:4-hydroxymandelate oxidase